MMRTRRITRQSTKMISWSMKEEVLEKCRAKVKGKEWLVCSTW